MPLGRSICSVVEQLGRLQCIGNGLLSVFAVFALVLTLLCALNQHCIASEIVKSYPQIVMMRVFVAFMRR